MRDKLLNLAVSFVIPVLLVLSSCIGQKVILTGEVLDKSGLPKEGLLTRIYLSEKFNTDKIVKQAVTETNGLFNLKVHKRRSYILEISGKRGSGRLFLPAESYSDTLHIIYPVAEKIIFLHTNDQHFDLNHLEEFKHELSRIRGKYNDVYLLSAGDIFVRHPHRWIENGILMDSTVWYAERALKMVSTMNSLDYDLMTLGNHEVSYIEPFTRNALEKAQFPLLAANLEIKTDNLPAVKSHKIIRTSTNRIITVLGLTLTNAGKDDIKLIDINETVEKFIFHKDSSDVFLVLSHIGLNNDLELAKRNPEIDAIIGGHTHHLLQEAALVNSVLVAQAGGNPHIVSDSHPTYLGKVVLTLENGKITEKKGNVIMFGQPEEDESTDIVELPEYGLCAYRGAMERYPENTLIAFQEAVKAGAHMIAFDVRLSRDNELVVIHDDTVDRTSNGSGKVSELTLSQIRQIDAGSWKSPEFKGQHIPTFPEVLNEMPINIWLNIQIKGEGEIVRMVAEILAKENRLHQAVIACSTEAAKSAKSVVPGIKICITDSLEPNWNFVLNAMNSNADFIQLSGRISKEFAEYAKILKADGILVNYFGTDSSDDIKQLFDCNINFPMVNDITKTIRFADELGIEPVIPVFRK